MGGYGQPGYGSPYAPSPPPPTQGSYGYVTWPALVSALLQRLQDTYTGYGTNTGAGYTTPTEAALYITEALQTLNVCASIWNTDFIYDFAPSNTWGSLNVPNSPRQRTTTDTNIYTLMQYHLLEPPSGGVWTGTTQFNITAMSQALQYRRDELLQVSGANIVNLTQASPVAGYRTTLPDTLLDLRRVRWIPSTGAAYPLAREDRITTNAYGGQNTTDVAYPDSWLITANTPLQFDVNSVPPLPGQWDMLALEAGATLAPPKATILGLPNDWCWLAKWGALSDLLSNSPEGSDKFRAEYCIKRYTNGMKAMLAMPWLLDASVEGLSTDTPSVQEMDAYAQNWEVTWPMGDPQVVVGGVDLIALAPFVSAPNPTVSLTLTVLGNAPVNQSNPVQLARDGVDAVLAYAQHLAMFKAGGAEFAATFPLYEQFEAYCRRENARYAALGISRPEMIAEGGRGDEIDPRFEEVEKNG